jgi:hypothetical protein
MRRLVLGLLVGLCACAERDNPWDPANRSDMAQAALPAQPVPGPSSEVVLPDSASRDPANPYFANLQSAMSAVKPGDTLWIQGGRSYVLTTGLEMVLGGAAFHWVVIRSFGGEARIVDGDPGSISALLTLTGPGYVELRGLAFVLCSAGDGFRANGLQGPLLLDSCRFDSNGTYGVETRGLQDSLVLRDVSLIGDLAKPPLLVDSPVDSQEVRFQ